MSASSAPAESDRNGRPESAVIVPVELPVAIARLRDRLDWAAARGVPPHVTLLYPFVPPAELSDAIRHRIERIVSAEPSFSFVLGRMSRWPSVVWLAPEPDEPFRRLTSALHAEFPRYPPYGGAHAEVIPHVTIAETSRPDWLEAAERALPAMLPVRDVAREAWVIAEVPGGGWTTRWKLPLGRSR
jgi:2'-5' RNA ligase